MPDVMREYLISCTLSDDKLSSTGSRRMLMQDTESGAFAAAKRLQLLQTMAMRRSQAATKVFFYTK